jgi:FKBP-type peptidyl-prolyl cis-trans isomerase 2
MPASALFPSHHNQESSLRTAQPGDQVSVHYVKRSENGGVVSSRGRAPLVLTVGTEHRRLPGLAAALVGRRAGERIRLLVPAEQAYGLPRPERVPRLPHARFPKGHDLTVGSRVYVAGRNGPRLVRIVAVRDDGVVVDANHPWAGQTVKIEAKIVSILGPPTEPQETTLRLKLPPQEHTPHGV